VAATQLYQGVKIAKLIVVLLGRKNDTAKTF
jgi:hypothetical protein